jgi:hypothetical protein
MVLGNNCRRFHSYQASGIREDYQATPMDSLDFAGLFPREYTKYTPLER